MKKITVSVAEDIKRKFIRTGSLCILAGCIGIVTGLIQVEGALGITHVANILGFAPVDGRKLIVILALNLYMIYFGIIIYITGSRFAALEAE